MTIVDRLSAPVVRVSNTYLPPALPVRPRPYKDEATLGYLIRAAEANGFRSPRQLHSALRGGNDGDLFEDLCARVRLSPQERSHLFGAAPCYWAATRSGGEPMHLDINHSQMRWCPLCISESSYLRGSWILKLSVVCARHKAMLCDCCYHCGEPQRLERSAISRCPCGARLDACAVPVAPMLLVRLQEAMSSSLFGGDRPDNLPILEFAEWRRLVRYIGQFTEHPWPRCPGRIAALHRLDVASLVMLGTARLLDQWPKNFNALLDSFQNREVAMLSIRRAFGRLYRVLYVDLRDACFQFLRSAFENYLHDNWWGVVCERNRLFKPDTVASHPRLTVRQAALQAGTAPSVVRHLLQTTSIPAIEAMLPSGRKARSIHQDDVSRIAAIASEGVTLEEAASMLRLPKRRVRELIAGRVITPSISRRDLKTASWLIPKRQIDELSNLPGEAKCCVSRVSVGQVMKYWRLREGECCRLVLALRDRVLVPTSQSIAGPLGEVQLEANEVREWLSAERVGSSDGLSVDQAAGILGIKQQTAYDLVRRGLLRVTVSRSLGRRVSPAAIQDFQRTYIALVELARMHGRSPKYILMRIEIRPVCGPTVDGVRQYFFRRTDIECAL